MRCAWSRRGSSARAAVALPYLLWLCAAATFGLPVSYDYNLIYLPLAAFAVWDRRDGVAGAALILSAFAWAQPFIFLEFPGRIDVLFFAKMASLVLVGVCIVRRVTEASELADVATPVAWRGGATATAEPAVSHGTHNGW